MRIIAGCKKGLKLFAPEGEEITRPTSDRAKEALFGSLQFTLTDASVLDMFAGSGALGIEALSRGAAFAAFIDENKTAIECIRRNIKNAGFEGKSCIINSEFDSAIKRLAGEGKKFDFVFIDPPYKSGLYEKAFLMLDEFGLIDDNSKIIAEHSEDIAVPEIYRTIKTKKYGKAYLTYLERERNI